MSAPEAAARDRPGLRWPLFGLPLILSMFVIAAVVESGNRPVGSLGLQGLDLLWGAAWLGLPAVGAAILARRGRNPIGMVLYAVGACVTLGLLANAVAVRHAFVAPVPAGPLFIWLAAWVMVPAFGLMPLFLFLFPTGHARSRTRRVFATLLAGVVALSLVVWAVRPVLPLDGAGLAGAKLVNPLGIPALADVVEAAVGILSGTLAVLSLLTLLDAVRRLFWGHPVERRQLRWVALSFVPFPVLLSAGLVLAGGAHHDLLVPVAFFVSLQGVAVAVLVAISRYRLYEIDRLVSRTVSYALLTGVLAGVYVVSVVLVSRLLAPLGAGSELAVAAATLLAAALFAPARRRIQSAVDRRFNRARCNAERVVARFRARLRDEVEIEDVAAATRIAAIASVQPARASLWLTWRELPR